MNIVGVPYKEVHLLEINKADNMIEISSKGDKICMKLVLMNCLKSGQWFETRRWKNACVSVNNGHQRSRDTTEAMI